mmetsp:Transcript_11208/g.18960  ORF Transcript_11208/g.18960 Transcript_11208/m.18960 type:complete len:223 (-) Transcript_11208:49-717(-)
MRPSTSSVSSMVPPSLVTTLMLRRSTLVSVSGLMMWRTASTAMGDRICVYWATTLEPREVEALLNKDSRSLRLTGMAIASRISLPLMAAFWKDSATTVGLMPFLNRGPHAPSRDPASTTTDVVPSPASMSCAFDRSTIIFPAGWTSFICFMMVAPSFVIVTSPSGALIILSIPRGPRLVRTASATAWAARMLDVRTSFCFSFSMRPLEALGTSAMMCVWRVG